MTATHIYATLRFEPDPTPHALPIATAAECEHAETICAEESCRESWATDWALQADAAEVLAAHEERDTEGEAADAKLIRNALTTAASAWELRAIRCAGRTDTEVDVAAAAEDLRAAAARARRLATERLEAELAEATR